MYEGLCVLTCAFETSPEVQSNYEILCLLNSRRWFSNLQRDGFYLGHPYSR